MSAKYIGVKTKWYVIVLVLLVSLVIFAVSVGQASWANISEDVNFDRFRINPVEFEMDMGDGIEKKVTYYLPQINQVPGQIFYPIKSVRDNLWLKLSAKNNRDAKLYLLLADKKIAESLILSQRKDLSKKYMYKTAWLAVEYLKTAEELSQNMDNIIEADKISSRVDMAKYFYSQILQQLGEISNNRDEYMELSKKVLSV